MEVALGNNHRSWRNYSGGRKDRHDRWNDDRDRRTAVRRVEPMATTGGTAAAGGAAIVTGGNCGMGGKSDLDRWDGGCNGEHECDRWDGDCNRRGTTTTGGITTADRWHGDRNRRDHHPNWRNHDRDRWHGDRNRRDHHPNWRDHQQQTGGTTAVAGGTAATTGGTKAATGGNTAVKDGGIDLPPPPPDVRADTSLPDVTVDRPPPVANSVCPVAKEVCATILGQVARLRAWAQEPVPVAVKPTASAARTTPAPMAAAVTGPETALAQAINVQTTLAAAVVLATLVSLLAVPAAHSAIPVATTARGPTRSAQPAVSNARSASAATLPDLWCRECTLLRYGGCGLQPAPAPPQPGLSGRRRRRGDLHMRGLRHLGQGLLFESDLAMPTFTARVLARARSASRASWLSVKSPAHYLGVVELERATPNRLSPAT